MIPPDGLQQSKNVTGVMVMNQEGMAVKSTLDSSTTVQYGQLIGELAEAARGIVRDLDPTNQLTFLRVKSVKHEVGCQVFFYEEALYKRTHI